MIQLAFLFGVLVLRTGTHMSPPIRDWATWVLHESLLSSMALAVVVGFTVATGALYLIAPIGEKVEAE
jgi:CDP-diacylglycerol--glycerol-3-phosphate 3-phosphatidyltransferase